MLKLNCSNLYGKEGVDVYLADESQEINECLSVYNKLCKQKYRERFKVFHSETYVELEKELESFDINLRLEVCTIRPKIIARIKNYYRRITSYLMSNSSIFLTITFTDKCLSRTNAETRRRYVKDFLNSECAGYVANIDFGKQNGREHYHAIVVPKKGKIDYLKWEYGTINGKRIPVNTEDLKDIRKHRCKLSEYLTKLGLHSVKDTTLNQKLIYSRKDFIVPLKQLK